MHRDIKKRTSVRRNLILYLPVIDRSRGNTIGYVGDITVEGLLIMSDDLLTVSEKIDIEITLPEDREYSGKRLRIPVTVQWSRRDHANPDVALSGCIINNTTDQEKKLINTLISRLGFSNGQRKILYSESSPAFTEPEGL